MTLVFYMMLILDWIANQYYLQLGISEMITFKEENFGNMDLD